MGFSVRVYAATESVAAVRISETIFVVVSVRVDAPTIPVGAVRVYTTACS